MTKKARQCYAETDSKYELQRLYSYIIHISRFGVSRLFSLVVSRPPKITFMRVAL